jgi:hypothetical protein
VTISDLTQTGGIVVRAVRGWFVGVVTVLLCLLWTPAHADQRSGLGLDISSAQSTYAPGTDIQLTFRVTNNTATSCQVSTIPDGAVLFTTVTRDGNPVPWQSSSAEYRAGYGDMLAANLTTLQPGGHADITVRAVASTDPAKAVPLRTVSPLPTSEGLVTAWQLGPTGRYTVSADYAVPRPPGSSVCAGATGTASVAFTVGTTKAFPWRWVIIGGIGLVVLILLIVFVVRRSRRHGMVASVIIALLAAAATQVVHPPTATAGPNDSFAAAFNSCTDHFEQNPKNDPAGIMPAIRKGSQNGHIDYLGTTAHEGDDTHPETVIGPDGHAFIQSVVVWNPDDTTPYKDDPNATVDDCANLYHELVHAAAEQAGQENDSVCYVPGGSGNPVATREANATLWENQYRLNQGDTPRSNYSGQSIPTVSGTGKAAVDAAMSECSPTPVPPDTTTTIINGVKDGAVWWAKKTGDPHVTTFDGLHYDFQSVGEYVDAKAGNGFELQSRQAPFPGREDRLVSVNTADAMKVGTDRVGFYLTQGEIEVHINGKVVSLPRGNTKLPGGGTLTRRDSGMAFGSDGYTVVGPDGSAVAIDSMSLWGLAIEVSPADADRGKLTGLLGNFDGNDTNDLVTRDGKPIPAQPDYNQLYHTFGDSWRISQAESLFDYTPGQTTATFTDRTYPARPLTVNDLSADERTQATAMCKAAGVTDQTLLNDCILDVARTGQPSFGASAGAAQRITASSTGPTGQPTGPTKPGSTLHDGDVVTGSIDQPNQTVDYRVDMAAGDQFELLDVTGQIGAQLVDAPGGTPLLPGPYQYAVTSAGHFTLRVSATGKYGFRFVTLKPRRIPVQVGTEVHPGDMDVPGRVDIYVYTPTGVNSVQVVSDIPCGSGMTYGFDADSPNPGVRTPGDLCFGYPARVDGSTPQLVMVWSDNAKTGKYSFSLQKA